MSAVSFNDLFTDGKADAGAGIFRLRMESLEHDKDAIEKLFTYSYAVVAYGKYPSVISAFGRDVNAGLRVPAKLDRV